MNGICKQCGGQVHPAYQSDYCEDCQAESFSCRVTFARDTDTMKLRASRGNHYRKSSYGDEKRRQILYY